MSPFLEGMKQAFMDGLELVCLFMTFILCMALIAAIGFTGLLSFVVSPWFALALLPEIALLGFAFKKTAEL